MIRFASLALAALMIPLMALAQAATMYKTPWCGCCLGHAKYLEYALSVHNSGEYLMRILNDLRDLSRAEIGVLDLEETTLDVGLALERELQNRLFVAHDAKEGLAAYNEKRKARFTGP